MRALALLILTGFLAPFAAHAAMRMTMPMAPAHLPPQGLKAPTHSWGQARTLLAHSLREGHRTDATVAFKGRHIRIVVVANAPHHPDMTFEAGGLTDPTLSVTAGALVTVTLLNMDHGPGMSHGMTVTATPPPYPVVPTGAIKARIAQTGLLAPSTSPRLRAARYAIGVTTFRIERPGTYYYLCPVPGHAKAFRMYGRLLVTGQGKKHA